MSSTYKSVWHTVLVIIIFIIYHKSLKTTQYSPQQLPNVLLVSSFPDSDL